MARLGLTKGYTLIEVIVLIVIIGIAAAGLITLYGAIARQPVVVTDRQKGVLLVEACAEKLFSSRRLLVSSDTGTVASCVSSELTRAICECHASLPLKDFEPYTPIVTVTRRGATGAGALSRPALCYTPPGTGAAPNCVQVEVGAQTGPSAQEIGPRVFFQLSEY